MAKGFPNTGATVIDTSADLPTAGAALEGVMVFQKDTNELKICDGSSWVSVVDTDTPPALTLINPTSVAGTGVTNSGGAISFSGGTTVNVNGAFTSAFDNYKISILFNGTADSTLQMRMRLSGTDNSASTYGGYCQVYSLGGGSLITEWAQPSTSNSMRICDHSPGKCYTDFDLMAPNLAQATFAAKGSQYDSSNTGAGFWYGAHTTATAFDGFSVFAAAGNIAGTLRIYGYRNSI